MKIKFMDLLLARAPHLDLATLVTVVTAARTLRSLGYNAYPAFGGCS